MKQRYNIVLSDSSLQDQVLSDDCCDMEVYDTLDNLDGVVTLLLTPEEAEKLEACVHITAVELEMPVEDMAYTPRTVTKEMRTKYTPSTGGNGADYHSTMFHFSSDQVINANSGPVGWFDGSPSFEDNTISNQPVAQHYAGEFVDIVAIEAGTPVSSNDSHDQHPDFLDDSGNSRFVKMDWDNHNGSISSGRNRQVTNDTEYFSDHAIGVLSAAGGLVCGFAKVSSLRVIYLSDGVTTAYDAVRSWHISKPVNPVTGVRNATLTTGAWGYSGVDFTDAYPVDSITEIRSYDSNGNETTTPRPVGGWLSDLTPFIDANMAPRVIEDPDDNTRKWMISVPNGSRATSFDTALGNYASTPGIYHFKSAGNSSYVGAGPTDPQYNNRITIEAGTTYTEINYNSTFGTYSFGSETQIVQTNKYPLRSYENGGDNYYTIGACQHSEANPLGDDYSARGPMIDLWANGAYTWTSYPTSTYQDGKWGYFSGTSCAAPVAAGVATMHVCWFFDVYGEYPSHDQLLDILRRTSQPALESEGLIDWDNSPPAADYPSSRLYSSSNVNTILSGDSANGGVDVSDLFGSTTRRIHVPSYMLYNTSNQVSSELKRNYQYVSREPTRVQYPRRKIAVG